MIASRKFEKDEPNLVKQLRLRKLSSGQPFLIYSEALPERQGYLEYPDGRIYLVTLQLGARDFTLLRELSLSEANTLRIEFDLTPLG